MKNIANYSEYECPYSHIEKDCGHKLHGPEGHEDVYGIWCACSFRGPVFCLDPKKLKLEKITDCKMKTNGIFKVCCLGTTHPCVLNVNGGYCCAKECMFQVSEKLETNTPDKNR